MLPASRVPEGHYLTHKCDMLLIFFFFFLPQLQKQMKQVAGSAALHAGLRSHAIRRIQFQTARQADLVRRVLRTARQTFKLVHISNQQDFGRNSLYFSQLFSSSFSSSILERVQLLRLWFATCCWSIRPNGPTSRTFAPTGKVYQVENDGRH